MRVVFISACYNASKNLENLISSLVCQNNTSWKLVLIDDLSDDDTVKTAKKLIQENEQFDISLVVNENKKWALRNIVETARSFQNNDNDIIACIDGDDELCNENTVELLIDAYKNGNDIVWTAHKWDINNLNISKDMPKHVNPYQWPWCTSHLRTFKSTLLKKIGDSNFKDLNENWFKRGYDQALMLPLLFVSNNRKYINEICYLYKINSVSVNDRDWCENNQHSTINIVRSRGFIDR